MKKLLVLAASGSALAVWTSGPAAGQARLWEEPGPCDRSCLIEIVDSYLAAMVAHDAQAAPLGSDIRFTENTEPKTVGEGLWATASAEPATFKIYVPDPVARQVGFIGIMEESGMPIQLGLRLKVEDGKITEAEHLVVRNLGENNLPNLKMPRPGLTAAVLPEDRLPRELMLMIGASYYDSIEQSDGDATLYADDCERRENGMITAGGEGIGFGGLPRQGCYDQMNSRTFTYIDSIDLRRVWIADEVTGLVFGLSQFRHSMKDKEITVIGRDGQPTTRAMNFDAFDLPAAHIFKVEDSRIHEIEAMGFTMPYMSKNGWSDFLR
jgi:hypothetical protein